MLIRNLSSVFVASLLTLTVGTHASAQSVVTGLVRDDSTGRPLVGVEVIIEGAKQQARTDSAGRYSLEVAKRNRVAVLRYPGYQPLRFLIVVKRDSVQADASLIRAARVIRRSSSVEATPTVARWSFGRGANGLVQRQQA